MCESTCRGGDDKARGDQVAEQDRPCGGVLRAARDRGIVNFVRRGGLSSRERDSYMTETATMTPDPQRLRALERANAVRLARAELKRRIAGGCVSAAQVILDCPSEASSWSVGDLLMSQRRWGATRCRKFLVQNEISEVKQIGALTERQRHVLAGKLARCESVQAPMQAGLEPPLGLESRRLGWSPPERHRRQAGVPTQAGVEAVSGVEQAREARASQSLRRCPITHRSRAQVAARDRCARPCSADDSVASPR